MLESLCNCETEEISSRFANGRLSLRTIKQDFGQVEVKPIKNEHNSDHVYYKARVDRATLAGYCVQSCLEAADLDLLLLSIDGWIDGWDRRWELY